MDRQTRSIPLDLVHLTLPKLSPLSQFVTALVAAVILTAVFWNPLWQGAGLIGGDIYFYFLPQKQMYADALRAGEWPLWNNRVGHGYPMVGESQTGVFYPFHLALYSVLSVDRAFSVSLLLHYVIACMGTWLLARRKGLTSGPALLAALSFTYGWFPGRASLEWAITTGAWLPLALWLADGYLSTRWWRYLFWLAIVLAVQMLAGHFLLAFVTQLTLVGWIALHWLFDRTVLKPISETAPSPSDSLTTDARPKPVTFRTAAALIASIILGFALAAVQLAPTWELKQLSQRKTVTEEHDPAYGYLPPKYLLQTVAPWYWYAYDRPVVLGGEKDPRDIRFESTMFVPGPRTNRTEAHLYFGLLPLLLAVGCVAVLWVTRGSPDPAMRRVRREIIIWLILGSGALVYATGCLIPVSRHLPGFSFFEGAGRYGIVTSLAVALLAGICLQYLLYRFDSVFKGLIPWLVCLVTIVDLYWVSLHVPVALMREHPPLEFQSASILRKELAGFPQARLLTPATNAATLLGVSSLPPYLGLAPAAYFDPQLKLPDPIPYETPATPEQIDWLRRAGVTHLLLGKSLDLDQWNGEGDPVLSFEFDVLDPMLNRILNTPRQLKLYRLLGSRGRTACLGPGTAKVLAYHVNSIAIEAVAPRATTVVLTDLAYPGWTVTVDGQPATALTIDGMYRGVEIPAGAHRIDWTYRPASLYRGAAVSLTALLTLLTLAHLRFWHWRPKPPPRIPKQDTPLPTQ